MYMYPELLLCEYKIELSNKISFIIIISILKIECFEQFVWLVKTKKLSS